MKKSLIFLFSILLLMSSAVVNVELANSATQDKLTVGVCYSNTASTFINKDRALMQEAGIKVLRLSFTPDTLANLARLVPAVINAKIKVLGMLYNRPLLDTNNINGWSSYVYNTVSSYKNYVKDWEIWNEPDWNTGFAPNGQVGDVVKYVQWLKAGYTAAKQADPTCNIIGGSISVVQDNTLTWLSRMYDNGAQPYMDALSVHPYSNTSPLPPAITSGGKAFWRAQDARDIMVQRGGANKPMWFTELGWRTSGSGVVVTESVQAQYLKDSLTYAETNWSWLDTFIIYQWQDSSGYYFGLLRTDGTLKPSFYAVKEFNAQSSESTPPPPSTQPPSSTQRVITSITWNPSRHVDVVLNIKYELLSGGTVVWQSVISRIPNSGTAVSPPVSISVPNIAADTLRLTVTDVELTGHTIAVNDAITLGEVQVGGDMKTFSQSFAIPPT